MARVDLSNVSVIIPVVGDQQELNLLIQDLDQAQLGEILIACGDQSEYTISSNHSFCVLYSEKGRGLQIANAIEEAQGEWIWVLHADSRVQVASLRELETALKKSQWGAFRTLLNDKRSIFRLIGFLMNTRSATTSIFTGDQGIYFKRELIQQVGGFPKIPLLEDIECCKRLKQRNPSHFCQAPLLTSARRWQEHGVVRTVLLMWRIRLLYYFGMSATRLAQTYYRSNT